MLNVVSRTPYPLRGRLSVVVDVLEVLVVEVVVVVSAWAGPVAMAGVGAQAEGQDAGGNEGLGRRRHPGTLGNALGVAPKSAPRPETGSDDDQVVPSGAKPHSAMASGIACRMHPWDCGVPSWRTGLHGLAVLGRDVVEADGGVSPWVNRTKYFMMPESSMPRPSGSASRPRSCRGRGCR